MKKISRSKLIKKLDKVFSLYIRQRYAKNEIAECFTCGKQDHYKKLQCGHFQSRKYYSTRWDEINCQVQCAGCNVFKYGEQFIFSVNLNKKYGEGVSESLYHKAKQLTKYSTIDLEDLINRYNLLINQLN
jgi:hypothetical protein|tara:strand:+ start:604 stop:993 length:390 start_codon:yes stop_codon:yes gene_type:complete